MYNQYWYAQEFDNEGRHLATIFFADEETAIYACTKYPCNYRDRENLFVMGFLREHLHTKQDIDDLME